MNFELYRIMRSRGLRQRDLAKLVGEHESVTSRVINGIWNPDEQQKESYAKALEVDVADIFPRNGAGDYV